MAKIISIGAQDFRMLRENGYFYVDKTSFIRDWWKSGDIVTLITRPRRFGKTLNMSMLDCFFSVRYAGRGDLFEGLSIWQEESFRSLQGSYPVIFLSFAGVKGVHYSDVVSGIKKQLVRLFDSFSFLSDYDGFTQNEHIALRKISEEMTDVDAAYSLNLLSSLLEKYYGRKVLIFLDEYDTPLQEAYIYGYWDELVAFIRILFNNTFKTNSGLERGIMTGITRVSRESVFSDLNNLEIVTTTSEKYETAFGFTQKEVFSALDLQGFEETAREDVRLWYDGFTFGRVPDIYNPWSVTMYLDKGKLDTYWANTSSNGLVSKLIREGDPELKREFETLLEGRCVKTELDEQIIFSQLDENRGAVWSLLLAGGYLKAEDVTDQDREDADGKPVYTLSLTNREVRSMFGGMIRGWFNDSSGFSEFVAAMFRGDEDAMSYYMDRVALKTFSFFDAGKKASEPREPEKFYHGFVLGLLVDQAKTHILKSNRESGFGSYDVVLEPKDARDLAVIMEFKVRNPRRGEKNLEETARNALKQIEEKQYATDLLQRGILEEHILKYGFAFEGETCLVLKG